MSIALDLRVRPLTLGQLRGRRPDPVGLFCPQCGRYLEGATVVQSDEHSAWVDCPCCESSSSPHELHHVREAWADLLWPRITELEQQVLVAEVQRAEMAKRLEAVTAGRAVLLADPLVCLRLQALAARLDGVEAEDLRGLLGICSFGGL